MLTGAPAAHLAQQRVGSERAGWLASLEIRHWLLLPTPALARFWPRAVASLS
jgi:hypothetical protein